MHNFNLIVSSPRFFEEEAEQEILDLLEIFGDRSAESYISEVKGLVLTMTSLDPFTVTKKLKELISSEPWQIRYIMRVIPIETVIPTDLAAIAKTTRELALRINIDDTFRITVEKRHSDLSSKQVIAAMAAEINNRVRLQDPDWIVLAEIVGMQTGISVIRPGQIFSSILVKRDR